MGRWRGRENERWKREKEMRGGEKDRRRRIDEERSREGEVVGRRGCGEEGS